MKQGPRRWSMSLKYKEQHETTRNINQTHNPKVEGSNPSPATKTLTRNPHSFNGFPPSSVFSPLSSFGSVGSTVPRIVPKLLLKRFSILAAASLISCPPTML